MVTLLLSGSGVAVTSMQDCFIQAGQEDLWSSIMRREALKVAYTFGFSLITGKVS